MLNISEKSVANLIKNPEGLLHHLVAKSQHLIHLTNLLHQLLDPTLAEHCKAANLRDQTLVIEVDSAAWLTQIRYRIPELLEKLRQNTEFRDLQKIECYINPISVKKIIPKPKPHLSVENANLLKETAESLPTPSLKQALQNLASHGEKNI